MPELSEVLARLGLLQYLGRLNEEGFDRWETVLDITEQDLYISAVLNFKLGHRRILQREVASARGIPPNQALPFGQFVPFEEVEPEERVSPHAQKVEVSKSNASTGKRKYRRHPKPDENAPEKPPSAYVMFANRVRDELKGQNLSFTDIAKLVGEKWKVLDPEDKESYEYEASVAKEKFNSELNEYKKTDNYRDYVKYLTEFKSKTAKEGKDSVEVQESARKRPKLESLPSSSSMGTVSTAGSAGSVTSALSATAPPTGPGKLPALNPGALPLRANTPPTAHILSSSIHVPGTQSMPAKPAPSSPIQSSGDTPGYRDALVRTTKQQDELSIPPPPESDTHYFTRIHPAVQNPHIQQQSSYIRHQPTSITRGGSALANSNLRRHTMRHDEQFSPTSGSISGSISSSGSSSAPSLTPMTPSVPSEDGLRGNRSLPLPPGMGSSGGYFDQRSHGYQQAPQPSPRNFPPPLASYSSTSASNASTLESSPASNVLAPDNAK